MTVVVLLLVLLLLLLLQLVLLLLRFLIAAACLQLLPVASSCIAAAAAAADVAAAGCYWLTLLASCCSCLWLAAYGCLCPTYVQSPRRACAQSPMRMLMPRAHGTCQFPRGVERCVVRKLKTICRSEGLWRFDVIFNTNSVKLTL